MSQNTSCIFYLSPWTHKASSKYVIDGNFPLHVLISTYTIISRWIRTTCHCQKTAKDNTKILSLSNDYVVAVVSLLTASGSVLPSSYKVLTNASSGRYNRRLVRDTYEVVVPRLQGPFFCTDLKYICGAWEARKKTNIYICGTQVSDRHQY